MRERLAKWMGKPWPPEWGRCCCGSAPSSSSGPARVIFCTCSLPETIHVTFSVAAGVGGNAQCTGLGGITFPMTWDAAGTSAPAVACAGQACYQADITDANGCHWYFVWYCTGGTNAVISLLYVPNGVCHNNFPGGSIPAFWTCSPLSYTDTITVPNAAPRCATCFQTSFFTTLSVRATITL
jgi:hypothetical protein